MIYLDSFLLKSNKDNELGNKRREGNCANKVIN